MQIFQRTTELEKIAAKEIELFARKRGLMAELDAARNAAANAMLESDAGGRDEMVRIAALTEQITATKRAIDILRDRRPSAILAEFSAEARALRAQAEPLQREIAKIEREAAKYLRQLSALLDVQYDETILNCQQGDSGNFYQTKQARLRDELASIESRAGERESRQVPLIGVFDAEIDSDGEVIIGVLKHLSITPRAEAVQTWLDECLSNPLLRGQGYGPEKRRVIIRWSNGEIDLSTSSVQCAAGMITVKQERTPGERFRYFESAA